jgi:hypothetical protein
VKTEAGPQKGTKGNGKPQKGTKGDGKPQKGTKGDGNKLACSATSSVSTMAYYQ